MGIAVDATAVYWINRGTITDASVPFFDKRDGLVMRIAKPH
jgi:hypothetical protein